MTIPMRALAAAAAALLLQACSDEVYLVDTIDLELNFSPLDRPDALHQPWVTGAQVTVVVRHEDEDADLSRWFVESSDPAVVRVLSQSTARDAVWVEIAAEAAGEADLVVWRSEARRKKARTKRVRVAAPDEIRLYDHGHLLVGAGRDEAERDAVKIAAGGTATFLARYYAQGKQLHGNGALQVAAAAGLDAHREQSFLFEDRDWLQVTARELGPRTVTVSAGPFSRDFPVEVVPRESVAALDLLGENERGARDGELLTVLARGWDAEGDIVFGVEMEWDVDGLEEPGLGDLYRYEFKKGGAPRELRACVGELEAIATIRSGEGWVASSNDIGCRSATGDGGSLWALAALALARGRRRRG